MENREFVAQLVHEGKSRFEQANALNLGGKSDEAAAIYDELLTQNASNPFLLGTYGSMLIKEPGTLGTGLALLRAAVDRMKTPPSDMLANLGVAYKYAGQQDKAMEYLEKACNHEPSPHSLACYGSMFVNRGDPTEGIKLFERALKMDERQQLAHWNLSLALLETGQWDKAWEHHEWGMETGGLRPNRHPHIPRWDGTPGKTILVYGEQGLGDEIMFASMLPELMRQNTVIVECHKRLKTLFETAFGVKCYGTREADEASPEVAWLADEKIDCRVAIGSLGKWFRRDRESFPGTPYLKAESVNRGKKFRVGISWTGGKSAKRVQARSVPLSWWTQSILSNDCEFVSLQYTDCADEVAMVERNGYAIARPDAVYADDYMRTAELVKSCDLVISVCTSVIHLAGALGVPCWVMVPNRPAWRYQTSGAMPWYRSVRLYRQPKGDEASWRPVIERIGADLHGLLQQRQVANG